MSENVAEVNLYSFATGDPNPPVTRYTFDLAGWRDPGSNGQFRKDQGDGRSLAVRDWMKQDPNIQHLLKEVEALAHLHVKRQRESYITVAFQDPLGRWIAPAAVEIVADFLSDQGFAVSVRHRNLK